MTTPLSLPLVTALKNTSVPIFFGSHEMISHFSNLTYMIIHSIEFGKISFLSLCPVSTPCNLAKNKPWENNN